MVKSMTGNRHRAAHEIEHGLLLARGDTEAIWGWATPAGQRRAARRAALITRAVGLNPGMRVLEIGCGTGLFTEMFAASGAHLDALDLSPHLLDKARQRGLPPDRVVFRLGRFEDGDINGPFDAVIGSSVLHHLELAPALRRIRRVLADGGWMGFAEPNYMNPQIFVTYKLRRFFPHISPDEDAFFKERLKRSLESAGLTSVQITPFDWLHPQTPKPLIPAVERVGRILETTPLIRSFSGSLLIRAQKPPSGQS